MHADFLSRVANPAPLSRVANPAPLSRVTNPDPLAGVTSPDPLAGVTSPDPLAGVSRPDFRPDFRADLLSPVRSPDFSLRVRRPDGLLATRHMGATLVREGAPPRPVAPTAAPSNPVPSTGEADERLAASRRLVERVRQGDRAAFQEVAKEVGPALERFLTRRLRLDADTVSDVVQDTLFTAWRHMDRIRDADHLRPWLFRVARYKAITWMRRRGPRGAIMDSLDVDRESGREATHGQMARRAGAGATRPEPAARARERLEARAALSRLVGTHADPEGAPASTPSGPQARDDDLLRRLLHAALPGLRESYVAVVRLHYLYGHDTGVIAGLLGLRRTTVKMRLHRARRQLRTLVREAAADLDPAARRDVLARLDDAEESRRARR